MEDQVVLVIDPETTTTQIAIYQNNILLFLKSIKHKADDLSRFSEYADQVDYRTELIFWELNDNETDLSKIELIVARGGLVKPCRPGVYLVNDKMVKDLMRGIYGKHPINLGGLIADKIAKRLNKRAVIADSVVVDELDDIARISGHPLIERKSVFMALNQKFYARKYAKVQHRNYEDMNLIIVTIGTEGISVGAHRKGRVVDVNNALDGDGPFSIKRTGGLPAGDLVRLCFSGKYRKDELLEMITTKGGYAAYLGTDKIHEIDAMIHKGDEKALFISDACAYQVSKEIGAMYTVLDQEVDAIILTGYIFHSERFLANVRKKVGKLAEIALYPSLNDVEALAENAYLVLKGELDTMEYD